MPKQQNQQVPPSGREAPRYTDVDSVGFAHELTQIYWELRGQFTKERISEAYPPPEIPKLPNVHWMAEPCKTVLPEGIKLHIAKTDTDEPEIHRCAAVELAKVGAAKIPQFQLELDKAQATTPVDRTLANVKWQEAQLKWDTQVPPDILSAKIPAVENIKADLSAVIPPQTVKAQVQWTAPVIKPVAHQVPGALMVKADHTVEVQLPVGKFPHVQVINAGTTFAGFAPKQTQKILPAEPVLANITPADKAGIDFIPPIPPAASSAKTQWEADALPGISEFCPKPVFAAIGAGPVFEKPEPAKAPDRILADIHPVSEEMPKIAGAESVPIIISDTQVPEFTVAPLAKIQVPEVLQTACQTWSMPELELPGFAEQVSYRSAATDWQCEPVILQTVVPSVAVTAADVQPVEPYWYKKIVPQDMAVTLASVQPVDWGLESVLLRKIYCFNADIPACPEYTSEDFNIPEIRIAVYDNPEPPDLGLPKPRIHQEAPVQPIFMDSMSVWEALGGTKAFADDGIFLNFTTR